MDTFLAVAVINPFMHNFPIPSDTLQKSCSICCKIFKSVSDHFGTLGIKGLKSSSDRIEETPFYGGGLITKFIPGKTSGN